MANSVDSYQLASEEANCSESTLLAKAGFSRARVNQTVYRWRLILSLFCMHISNETYNFRGQLINI